MEYYITRLTHSLEMHSGSKNIEHTSIFSLELVDRENKVARTNEIHAKIPLWKLRIKVPARSYNHWQGEGLQSRSVEVIDLSWPIGTND
jgi:hypothetical protein